MRAGPFPAGMRLSPLSKRPIRLHPDTIATIAARALPLRDQELCGAPLASVVVPVHDNLPFTRMCLESVLLADGDTALEVIVVDNASRDGTAAYLEDLAATDPRVRVIGNAGNTGFAPAVNLGLEAARGDVLVLLNNDVIVTPGWLEGLRRHLENPEVGIVGPITNQAPDQSRVPTSYQTYGEMLELAASCAAGGGAEDVEALTMFCVAMRREVWRRLGPLDEQFQVGMFEDDDYCARARAAGLRLRLARDVFVHHFGGASFGDLVPDGRFAEIFDANRGRFEAKWGRQWAGHVAADDAEYLALLERMASLLDCALPANAWALVVSQGDDRLLGSRHRRGHFPQLADGSFSGCHPADDAEAVALLSQLRDRGWTHLALPAPSRWWLDHYPQWGRELERGGLVMERRRIGAVYRLPGGGANSPTTVLAGHESIAG